MRTAVGMWCLFALSAATLASARGTFLQSVRRNHEKRSPKCPAMFVAVLSRKNETETRKDLRAMWHNAGKAWGSRVTAKFAVCRHSDEHEIEAPSEIQLQDEADQFQDIMQMDCTDKYARGALTHKVQDIMRAYVKEYKDTHPLFMKVDDDTFVSPKRLCSQLDEAWTPLQRMEGQKPYMGLFFEEPQEWWTLTAPVRDPDSKWYEPYSKYPGKFYPVSASGGPGYVLDGELVKQVLDKGIADENMIYNEDRAVGIWMEKLKNMGEQVDFINVPGTDGYDFHENYWQWHTSGKWSSFPYALFHRLSGTAIKCLHELDTNDDPLGMVDKCWPNRNPGSI